MSASLLARKRTHSRSKATWSRLTVGGSSAAFRSLSRRRPRSATGGSASSASQGPGGALSWATTRSRSSVRTSRTFPGAAVREACLASPSKRKSTKVEYKVYKQTKIFASRPFAFRRAATSRNASSRAFSNSVLPSGTSLTTKGLPFRPALGAPNWPGPEGRLSRPAIWPERAEGVSKRKGPVSTPTKGPRLRPAQVGGLWGVLYAARITYS